MACQPEPQASWPKWFVLTGKNMIDTPAAAMTKPISLLTRHPIGPVRILRCVHRQRRAEQATHWAAATVTVEARPDHVVPHRAERPTHGGRLRRPDLGYVRALVS